MLSYQSLVPAHQDYENLGRCAVEVFAVTGAVHTPPLDSRFRENDELGGAGDNYSRRNRSCRLVPAGAGTPRFENWVHWLTEGSGGVWATHPAPSWGQAPALHFSCDPGLSLFGRRWLVSPARAGIYPGSESGTCFRTNRPCRLAPAHQGMKSRSCGLVQRIGTADSATPHPDPSGGQAPRLATVFDRATFPPFGHRSTIRHVSPVESRHRG